MKQQNGFLSQEELLNFLDTCYHKCVNGIQHVSPPIEEFARHYRTHSRTNEKAARTMIRYQIAKCTTSGVVTGFGGLLLMPVTLPANIGNVLYVQIRMIACTAYLAGYDLHSDQVQTLVYACLAGVSMNAVLKKFGVSLGSKVATSLVKKIPGSVLTKINQKIGFRLFTKFGTKGLLNLGKMIPVVGAAVNGGIDFAETKHIGERAYRMFFKNDFSAGDKNDPIPVDGWVDDD